MAEMKTFNGYEVVDAKARQNIAEHDTRITEVEKFFEAADSNGIIDKLAEVQKYIEDDAQAAADLIQSIADVDAKVDAIHIPENVSELNNDSSYLTEHDISNKSDIGHKHTLADVTDYKPTDLTGYATETYVNNQIDAIEFPVTDISGKSDIGHTHTLSEITDYKAPVIPTKVSQLTNDSTYTTKEYVDDADKKATQDIANISYHIQNILSPAITGKADTGHKHKLNEITDYVAPDLTSYATKTYVNNAVANVDVDLSSYATKTYVTNTVQAAIDDIPAPDLSAYAKKTDIPDVSGLASEAFVTAKIAEAELAGGDDDIDLSGYALTSDIPTKVSQLQNDVGYLTEHQSLTNYYTKAQTDSAIGEAIDGIEIPETDISGKADLVHQHSMDDITDYVAPDLSDYAKKSDIPAIPDIPSLDGYATEQYVDDAIAGIDIPECDGSKVYVITPPTLAGDMQITDELIELYNKVAAGEPVVCYWLVDSIGNKYYPTTLMYRVMDDYSYVQIEPSHISYSAGSYFKIGGTQSNVTITLTGDTYTARYNKGSSGDSYDIPTKKYVNDAIANIDFPEPNLSNYYTKTEVNTKIEEAVDGIDVPDVDLSNYYTKSEVEAQAKAYAEETKSIHDTAIETNVNTRCYELEETVKGFSSSNPVKQYVDNAISQAGVSTLYQHNVILRDMRQFSGSDPFALSTVYFPPIYTYSKTQFTVAKLISYIYKSGGTLAANFVETKSNMLTVTSHVTVDSATSSELKIHQIGFYLKKDESDPVPTQFYTHDTSLPSITQGIDQSYLEVSDTVVAVTGLS